MINKPVAWMYKTTYKNETEIDVISDEFKQSGKGGDCSEYSIPLYTHLVKEQDVKYDVTVRWDDKITHHKNVSVDTPLHYTHPVKELTDAEIRHIQAMCHLKDVGYDNFIMRFARAILRKAQEK